MCSLRRFQPGSLARFNQTFRSEESLYSTDPGTLTATTVKAVPYALWGNREQGEMLVWINEV